VFVSLPRGGDSGHESGLAWAAAVALEDNNLVATATAARHIDRSYRPGYLSPRPDVLLVNAAGRDHPRGAGLAIQLGAALDMPTMGITDRPIIAVSTDPWHKRGNWSPLYAGERLVGFRVRTLANANPITVHAAWRTSPELARDIVLETVQRTPGPRAHAAGQAAGQTVPVRGESGPRPARLRACFRPSAGSCYLAVQRHNPRP
jgi:deoxyribonuclease V